MKLYENISIDTWKKIADRVQKLNIYDFSDEEFNYNLEELKSMLSDLEISLDFCKRYPDTLFDIGLAALLQEIYSGEVEKDYKKANFYEKIHQLDALGIPSIEFRPVGFPDRVEGIALLKNVDNGDPICVNKCFTDGEFDVTYPDEPLNRWFDLVNLTDANYIINVLAILDANSKRPIVDPLGTYAILRNFNGKYPNKEAIQEIRYPGLCMYFKQLYGDRRQLILKQIFFKFDGANVQYSRKLVREPFNFHYE